MPVELARVYRRALSTYSLACGPRCTRTQLAMVIYSSPALLSEALECV